MKLPVINGNEIVPVRLIPLFTHDSIGQETLSGILANRLRVDGFRADPADKTIELRVDGELTNVSRAELGLSSRCAKDVNVFAYYLDENSAPVKMLSIEWDNIYRNISVLEPVLRKKEEVHDALFSEWSLKATKLLPPGVFLWRNDLDSLWKFHLSFILKWSGEHTDARILNYDAYIRSDDRGLYFEGFESQPVPVSQIEPAPTIIVFSDLAKTSNLPDRKGKKVPKEQRRKGADFTRVVTSLFNKLLEEGNTEVLLPKNIVEFLKCLKKRADGLDVMEESDATYGELITWVKPRDVECIKMLQPRIVTGSSKKELKPYTRKVEWTP